MRTLGFSRLPCTLPFDHRRSFAIRMTRGGCN